MTTTRDTKRGVSEKARILARNAMSEAGGGCWGARYKALVAYISELEKDSARLDWLETREGSPLSHVYWGECPEWMITTRPNGGGFSTASLRETLDLAMEEDAAKKIASRPPSENLTFGVSKS